MLSLIKNEYIKLFKKKTTYLWLAAVVFATIVMDIGIYLIVKYDGEGYEDHSSYSKESYQEQINYAKETKDPGYEYIVKYYQSLIDLDITKYNWKMEALSTAYTDYKVSTKLEETSEADKKRNNEWADKLIDAVEKNDYKQYVKVQAEYTKDSFNYEGSKNAINMWQYMIDNDSYYEDDSKPYKLLSEINENQTILNDLEPIPDNEQDIKRAKETIIKDKYRLDNKIYCNEYSYGATLEEAATMDNSCWKYIKLSEVFMMLVSLLMVIIAGGIVSSEYTTGTIKFYLINPKKRTKLIYSKYFTILSLTIISVISYFIINFVLGLILGGAGEIGAKYVYIEDGIAKSYSVIGMLLLEYAFKTIGVIVMATMAFAISTLCKKAALSTGIGVACLVGGSTVNLMLAALGVDWGRYLIFANLELTNIRENLSYYVGHTFSGALINLGIHMVVFVLMARDAFVRREV